MSLANLIQKVLQRLKAEEVPLLQAKKAELRAALQHVARARAAKGASTIGGADKAIVALQQLFKEDQKKQNEEESDDGGYDLTAAAAEIAKAKAAVLGGLLTISR